MILYIQSFIVRVQQKPAKKFTRVKVRTEQNPLSVVFRRLTKNPDLALLTEMPTHVIIKAGFH